MCYSTVLHPMLTFQLKVSGYWHVLQYCAASHANLSTEGLGIGMCYSTVLHPMLTFQLKVSGYWYVADHRQMAVREENEYYLGTLRLLRFK